MSNSITVVVGCNGFIGKSLMDALCREKKEVIGIDKQITQGHSSKNISQVTMDITDPKNFSELKARLDSKKRQAFSLVHLVGISDAQVCRQDVQKARLINVKALENIVTFFSSYPVDKILFISTGLVYGTRQKKAVDEETAVHPENTYAQLKWEAEQYLQKSTKKGIVLRFSNVYGKGMSPNTVIGTLLEQIRGNNVNLREYASVRDFIYIKDVVGALMKVLFSETRHQLYNVGTAQGVSIKELVSIAASLAGKQELTSAVPDNATEGSYLVLSRKRIYDDFGWKPRYSLRQGLEEMRESYA